MKEKSAGCRIMYEKRNKKEHKTDTDQTDKTARRASVTWLVLRMIRDGNLYLENKLNCIGGMN